MQGSGGSASWQVWLPDPKHPLLRQRLLFVMGKGWGKLALKRFVPVLLPKSDTAPASAAVTPWLAGAAGWINLLFTACRHWDDLLLQCRTLLPTRQQPCNPSLPPSIPESGQLLKSLLCPCDIGIQVRRNVSSARAGFDGAVWLRGQSWTKCSELEFQADRSKMLWGCSHCFGKLGGDEQIHPKLTGQGSVRGRILLTMLFSVPYKHPRWKQH